MKLKSILKDKKVDITYRTYYEDQDILVGYCRWNGKELESLDGDDYSVEDEFDKCIWDGPDKVTIWYESKWVSG